MGLLESIARWTLPTPAAHLLDVAEQVPAAVTAFAAEWNAGRGPLNGLRAFAAQTGNQVDDAAVAQVDAALRQAIAALSVACEVGARVSEWEPAVRAGVDATLQAVFGAAFWCAATRDTLRRWEQPRSET